MIEPPSSGLMTLLQEFQLCQPADLRRCRPLVRKLTHDLPAFDSVWIDALVQIERLTPFQGRILQSRTPQALKLGPCVLVDELGAAERSTRTFLARHLGTGQLCVAKVLETCGEELRERQEAIQAAIQRGTGPRTTGPRGKTRPGKTQRGTGKPLTNVILPQACLEHEGQLIVVSPFVAGRDLREIVVRRGRLPAGVVGQIARMLIETMAELERCQLVHGDLRTSKVRLTPDGRVVLTDCGQASLTNLWTQIHRLRRPERCETTPPELIGTDRLPDSRSEMYALGCLLWQLLAGRPVFPTGDALSRLAAHQTQVIADIREVAPDVDSSLAALINRLTSRDREQRPASFAELRETLRGSQLQARRTIRGYLSEARLQSITGPAIRPRRRWKLAVSSVCLVMLMLAGSLAHQGARARLLNIAAQLPGTSWTQSDAADSLLSKAAQTDVPAAGDGGQALPEFPLPDLRGVVRLEGQRDYPVVELNHAERILVRGLGEKPTRIVVGDEPLRIAAPQVILENIELVLRSGARGPAAASLALIQADRLELRKCIFRGGVTQNGARPVSLAWKPHAVDAACELVMENALLLGDGASLFLSATPVSARISNCLKEGPGALLSLPVPGRQQLAGVHCQHVTLRGADALLRLRVSRLQEAGEVGVVADRCVFDVAPRGAMFQAVTSDFAEPDRVLVTVSGDGSVSRPETRVMAPLVGDVRQSRAWERAVQIEGLMASPFRFAGPSAGSPEDSVVLDLQALPRISSGDGSTGLASPGINPEMLPGSRFPAAIRIGGRPDDSSR